MKNIFLFNFEQVQRNLRLVADLIKLFFLRFPIFDVYFQCFVTYRKISLIVKCPSLATKNGEILR